jgi:hypothetical protein
MIFNELSPYVIAFTILICILLAIRVQKNHLTKIDGLCAVAGCGLGLAITFLNIIYSNNYLITIGPLMAIASLVYLRFRDNILDISGLDLNVSMTTTKIFRILFWVFIMIALASYYTSPLYNISLGFYVFISLAVVMLGLEIISTSSWDKSSWFIIAKILFTSLIFRAGLYFISPYPIGSDSWVHAQIIDTMIKLGSTNIPYYISPIYPYSPIMHLYAIGGILLGGYSTKIAMFIVGSVLAISTVFVYLLVKKITNNEMLALLSMLLLNFADFEIQWSEMVIAMSFGIAIFSILLYLILTRRKYENLDVLFLVFFFAVLVLTHTVSAFIALVSIIALYIGTLVYRLITGHDGEKLLVNYKVCLLFIIIFVGYWTYAGDNFFWTQFKSLAYALAFQAEFLGRSDITMVGDRLDSILNIVGFLVMIYLGVIGCLVILSKKYLSKPMVITAFMSLVLFFIFFAFPVLGIRNILPYRWPAFIYIGFVVFAVIGLIAQISIIKKYRLATATLFIAVLFIFTFFMITNDMVSPPTPIYGVGLTQPSFWMNSEMESFKLINDSYDGIIMSDLQTYSRPFEVNLDRGRSASLWVTPSGEISWNDINQDLYIWRSISLIEPVQAELGRDGVLGDQNPDILLGQQFKDTLDENFSSVYDAGTTRGYLKTTG